MGRLVEYKGYKYLIESAKNLSDDYVILIGGDGPLKKTLQDQIEKNNLQQKVHLLGYISNEDKYAYLGACSLFCLSSIQKSEAFAIVQIEAMSCAKPIVATNIKGSGVPWVNAHGESGINVPVKNSNAITEAIVKLCENDTTYLEYCNRAKARFERLFTEKEMINNCLSNYSNVVYK